MNQQDKIDAYLLGRLEGEELKIFLENLEADSKLAEEVVLQKQLMAGIRTFGHDRMKAKLNKIHQEVMAETDAATQREQWLRIAVVTVGLLLLGLILWMLLKPDKHEHLYARFYQPYSAALTSRDGDGSKELTEASFYYKDGAFDKAAELLPGVIEKIPDNPEIRLALGICYLEAGALDEAGETFEAVLQSNDPLFRDHGRWYRALTHLKAGEKDACQRILQTLATDPNADHHEEAQELLRELL